MQEGDRGKMTVEKEGGTRGQEMIEVGATGGKMKGRKEVTVDVNKLIKRMMTGRKEARKKGTTEKNGTGKSQQPGRCKTEELL